MPNDYYNPSLPSSSNTLIRSANNNQRFSEVQAGFDLLPDLDDLTNGNAELGIDFGVADAYVITRNLPLTALVDGVRARFKATNSNTGASTVNVDTLGIKTLFWIDGTPMQAADVVAGLYYDIVYNGTAFLLVSNAAGVATRTSADSAATAADVVTTNADVVITNADVVTTNADAASTAADVLTTNADVVITNADVVTTNADAATTTADAATTNADVVITNADVVTTNANAVSAAASAAISEANANFKGLWSNLTGALAIPASVSHLGKSWQLLNDLADVTASEPGVTADWQIIVSTASIAEAALPRYSQALLSAADGTIVQFKAAALLDSIGGFPWQTIGPIISGALGIDEPMGAPTGASVDGSDTASIQANLVLDTPVSGTVTPLTGQYDRWYTGSISSLSSGAEVPLIKGGGNPYFSTVKVAFLRKSGGGSIQLKVGGVLVGSPIATGSGTPGEVDFISYSQAYAQDSVSVVTAGGVVEITHRWHEWDNATNVQYHYLSVGGLSLEDALSTALAESNLGDLLAEIDLNLVTFEAKESSTYLEVEFSKLCDILDSSIPEADKIICGSTPFPLSSSSDEDQRLQNAILEQESIARGILGEPYRYADKYAPFVRGGYPASASALLNELGADYYGDGTHFTQLGTEMANSSISRLFALASSVYAKSSAPVWNRSRESMLAAGSFFREPKGNEVQLNAEATFGLDWELKIPRSLEVVSDLGGIGFRVSAQTGSVSNIIPSTFDLGSDGSDITATINTLGGGQVWIFTDSGKDGADTGNCFIKAMIVPPTIAKADLTGGDFPANSMKGAMARVPDGSAGDGVYMAVGAFPSDWQLISTSGAV